MDSNSDRLGEKVCWPVRLPVKMQPINFCQVKFSDAELLRKSFNIDSEPS